MQYRAVVEFGSRAPLDELRKDATGGVEILIPAHGPHDATVVSMESIDEMLPAVTK